MRHAIVSLTRFRPWSVGSWDVGVVILLEMRRRVALDEDSPVPL